MTGAAVCRRAAVLTTSPATIASPAATRAPQRDERLAGVDGDANVDRRLSERVADRERRANSALRIVLVRDRSTEDGHDGVADELLDRAAVSLELRTRSRA